jgi:hypothetical protein
MTPAAILSAMLSLPPAALDRSESVEQRTALFLPVAEAIARVSRSDRQAALLIAQAWEDTKLARYVLEGRCHDGPVGQRCDNGKARGPWQVHKWCTATTLDGEARCALRAASSGMDRCRGHAQSPVHGAFAGLAARDCSWPGADRRVGTYRSVLSALRRAVAP